MNFKQIRTVVMAFWREFREDNVQGLAAQVAFHLLFSIVPLLIFLAALSGFISRQVGIDDAMVEVRQWLAARLPSE